jgi:ElaB/YqjD/DUF883 family membrane-anchored ribosome-binding protein
MEATGKPNGSINTNATDIRNSIEKATSTASAKAHNVVDKVADVARPAVDRIASGAHQTVDKLSGAATAAAGTIGQRTEQISAASAQLMDGCRTYVQANPLKAVGIAAVAGIILSRLFKLRS